MNKVYQFSRDGKFLAVFNNVFEAAKVTKLVRSSIVRACTGKTKYYSNSIWRYNIDKIFTKYEIDSEELKKELKESAKIHKTARIRQLSLDGKLIATWDSAYLAAISLGLKQGNICNVCKGKNATAYGFKWEYDNE